MFGGNKTCISGLFCKHCEQADHHPSKQRHLEKVEALEVINFIGKGSLFLFLSLYKKVGLEDYEQQNTIC